MAYKFTSNRLQIDSEFKNKTSLAIRFMLEAIHRDSTPNTPRDKGPLRDNVTKAVQGSHGTITWPVKYAVYQEKKKYSNYSTPGTGPRFAENSARKIAKDSRTYFKKAGL